MDLDLQKNGFLIDLDGVLVRNKQLNVFEDTGKFIEYLDNNNFVYRIATNNSRLDPKRISERLKEQSVNVDQKNILAPLGILSERLKSDSIKKIYLMGDDDLRKQLLAWGFDVVDAPECDVVLVGLDRNITMDKLKNATTALVKHRAKLMGVNRNMLTKDDDGMYIPGSGAVVEMLKHTVNLRDVLHFGKGGEIFNRNLFNGLPRTHDQMIFISDDPYGDLATYAPMGMKTVFITTGKYAADDLDVNRFTPDMVVSSLSELMSRLHVV